MKKINTNGIYYIEAFDGTEEWYWGEDYIHGDLYEAEEIYKKGCEVTSNRLIFVHYPDGEVKEPILAKKGQYFGRPFYYENQIIILLVDFPKQEIKIISYDTMECKEIVTLPLSIAKDCYNLLLKDYPLMLTRQGKENNFEILWPEKVKFPMKGWESFDFRRGNKLYFESWDEENDNSDQVVVRDINTGEIIDKMPGSIKPMPNGQQWLLN